MATPRVVISTRSSLTLPLQGWREVCMRARADGIDLDVARWIRRSVLLRGSYRQRPIGVEISFVWTGKKIDQRIRALIAEGATVVVPAERLANVRATTSVDWSTIASFRQALPAPANFVVALSPINYDGTRTHLDRISALRHIAQEWDFDLGLDLTGAVDHKWEAEAAVLRLGDRLKLVRFDPPAPDDVPAWRETYHLRDVIVARVLAAIADFGLSPTLSLKSRIPFWEWSNPVAIADQIALARSATLARFQIKSGPISSPPKRVG